MSDKKSSHLFTVNLDGLNLSDDHLQRIGTAVQKAVMTELGSIDLSKNQGGLLSRFDIRTRGIWYYENLEKFGI